MIFNEQYLKNKNRIFYHGSKSKVLDKSKAKFDWFFITTDINNAIMYCEKTEDINYIHSFRIKEPINIFNAKSKLDYEKLRKALLRKGKIDFVNNEMYKLKNFDWLFLDDTNISRTEVVDAIKDLGYDGFFNFEWSSDEMINAHFELNTLPSIGLFDIGCLTPLGTLSFDEIRQNTKYDELKTKSKKEITDKIKDVIEYCTLFKSKYGKLPNETTIENQVKSYIGRNYYTTLTDKDISDIIENVKKTVNESGVSTKNKDLFESYGKTVIKGLDITIPLFAKRKLDEQLLEFENIYNN